MIKLMLLGLWLSLSCAEAQATDMDIARLSIDISKELRCPMATNQNLFESETAIASELKAQIYMMLQQGKCREQILDFMVERYGEQIRYQPTLNAGTALLWLGPVLLLLVLPGVLLFFGRSNNQPPHDQENPS
ncbi:cytochrome c-type biogenesis protein CcmH [Shewanella algae]|uniref:cytochrome c-type biogenesis protein n=1 Tax=Shewanella algae TaxID=38313 RepID=UPI001AAD967B|nr:cytochrome c-type biogenesis protein CcmH [Shewanella algae]MBO2602011.1 cytochrome c-type biogenesis protein CcmH [Shewanella algae]